LMYRRIRGLEKNLILDHGGARLDPGLDHGLDPGLDPGPPGGSQGGFESNPSRTRGRGSLGWRGSEALRLDLGVRQDDRRVDAVELPPWASDAYHFVHDHRLALESEPVSRTSIAMRRPCDTSPPGV
jgi:hypothetical protein